MEHSRNLDVTCWGQICVDHIFQVAPDQRPRAGRELYCESYSTALGGGAGIVAVTLARLGYRAGLVSRIGADAPGITLLSQLRAEGVDVSHLEVLRDRATDVSVAFTSAADRGFLSHMAASRALDTVGMDSPCLANTRHLHFCLSTTEGPEHWRGLLRQAHQEGTTVSIDLGWRDAWDPRLCAWLGEADLLFPNRDEALRLAHTRSLDRAMRMLGAGGAVVVVKRGSEGASVYHRGRRYDHPSVPVAQVLDPTGAGDSFAAGFLWAWLAGRPIDAALAAGSLCAARCVQQIGGLAVPPKRDELETIMQRSLCDE